MLLLAPGLAFTAIVTTNDLIRKPIKIDAPNLTDLTDPEAAQALVDFYNVLPKRQFNGPISDQPKDIQNWMKNSPQIRNCKLLNLNKLGIKKIPNEIGLFHNLKKLRLDQNQIKELPPAIGNLRSLTELSSYHNKLEALPAEIGKLESLTNLRLSHNKLQALPAEINNLLFLANLDLTFNNLQSLPAEMGNLQSLESLNLSFNQFQILEIGHLDSLEVLNLYGNQLQAFRLKIGNFKSLRELILTNNPVEPLLPAEIGNLRHNGRGFYFKAPF